MTNKQNEINNKTYQLIENMHERMSLLASVQMAVVTHLTDNDNELMRKIMASVFSNDDFRNDFTQYLNDENAPDKIKLFMTEVNETIAELKEEE